MNTNANMASPTNVSQTSGEIPMPTKVTVIGVPLKIEGNGRMCQRVHVLWGHGALLCPPAPARGPLQTTGPPGVWGCSGVSIGIAGAALGWGLRLRQSLSHVRNSATKCTPEHRIDGWSCRVNGTVVPVCSAVFLCSFAFALEHRTPV